MKKWAYMSKRIEMDYGDEYNKKHKVKKDPEILYYKNTGELLTILNMFGQQGWELVSCWGPSIFKREGSVDIQNGPYRKED
jgi:hypothetical protein